MNWITVLKIVAWIIIACVIVLFGIVILEGNTNDEVLKDNRLAIGGLSMIVAGGLLGFTNSWNKKPPLDNP